MFKFCKAIAKESVFTVLDLVYRLASIFVEWYYDWIDKK